MREITSSDNEKLKDFTQLYKTRKLRDERNVCILDGAKLVSDAAKAGHHIRQLFITDDISENYMAMAEPAVAACDEYYVLRGKAAHRISDLKAPQGIFAVVDRPVAVSVGKLAEHDRILGICGLQNPENAGACIRTAAALGYDGILVSSDCADLWSARASRASAGTQLSCDIAVTEDFASSVSELNRLGVTTMASALHKKAESVDRIGRAGKLFIAIGNEGHGLPAEVIEQCGRVVLIPMSDSAESLNAAAAAAILMWELRKK